MDLRTYILRVGDDIAAAQFRVTARAVASWRRYERYPRPSQAARIVEVTGGLVDYAGIYSRPEGDDSAC